MLQTESSGSRTGRTDSRFNKFEFRKWKTLFQNLFNHIMPSLHFGDRTTQKCHTSFAFFLELDERVLHASAQVDVLIGLIFGLLAKNEVYDRRRICQTVRMMVATLLDNHFYRTTQFQITCTHFVHILQIRNSLITIAAYTDYWNVCSSYRFQIIQRIAFEVRHIRVLYVPFLQHVVPQLSLLPSGPAIQVANRSIHIDTSYFLRILCCPVEGEESTT